MAALMGGMGAPHRPVLLRETIELLKAHRGGLFVDGTLGFGGHSEAIVEASPAARVIGSDGDRETLKLSRERLKRFGHKFLAVHENVREVAGIVEEGIAGDV